MKKLDRVLVCQKNEISPAEVQLVVDWINEHLATLTKRNTGYRLFFDIVPDNPDILDLVGRLRIRICDNRRYLGR